MDTTDLLDLPPEMVAKIALTLSPADYFRLMGSNRRLREILSNGYLLMRFAEKNDLSLNHYVANLVKNNRPVPVELLEKYYDYAVYTATIEDNLGALLEFDAFQPLDWNKVAKRIPFAKGTAILDYFLYHHIKVDMDKVATSAALSGNFEKLRYLMDLNIHINWSYALWWAFTGLKEGNVEGFHEVMDLYQRKGISPDWRKVANKNTLALIKAYGTNVDWDEVIERILKYGDWEELSLLFKLELLNPEQLKRSIVDGTFGKKSNYNNLLKKNVTIPDIEDVVRNISGLDLNIDWKKVAKKAIKSDNAELFHLASSFVKLDDEETKQLITRYSADNIISLWNEIFFRGFYSEDDSGSASDSEGDSW